ncbi:MAG: hypothetical protein QM727_04865 [Niabella sp.]
MSKFFKYGSLTILLAILLVFFLRGRFSHETFDSEKWKNWKETEAEWSLRWDMMNSLRNTHYLKGKTAEEITNLLGEPETKTNKEFRYYLGFAKRGIDTGTLIILFDETGTVSDFYVHRG